MQHLQLAALEAKLLLCGCCVAEGPYGEKTVYKWKAIWLRGDLAESISGI